MCENSVPGKASLRAQIKERKSHLTTDERDRLSKKVVKNIEQCEVFRTAHSVLCYWPLPDEVQIEALIEKYWHSKQIYLPVIVREKLELRLFEGRNKMKPGKFGILEPQGTVLEDDIDLILVPGVAFDRQGHRLGRGKGYYDQFLPTTKAYKVGVAFRFQIADSVPVDPWDVNMDTVITD